MLKRHGKSKRNKLTYMILILLVIIVAITGVTWKLASKTSINPTNATTANQNTKGQASGSSGQKSGSSTTTSSSTSDSSQNKSGPSTTSSGVTLAVPTGNFVSDHHPNLSGHPAPNQMASSCTTTPGASCKIAFTSNGVTKSLAPETTDSGGSVYWNWTLQSAGLTQGTWSIEAIATLNDNTKTASDPQNLVVAQ